MCLAGADPLLQSVAATLDVGKLMLRTTHSSLGKIVPGIVFLAVSPDKRHVAHVVERAGRFFVVLDGVEQKEYDWIAEATPLFSPDSRRMAYIAMRHGGDTGPYPVVDGVELKQYFAAGLYLRFSPDGRRLAYAAAHRPAGGQFIVVDEVAGKEYDAIGAESLRFSPDGRRFAYGARRGNKWCMVIDGREEQEYDGLGTGLAFSPDSQRWAYMATRGHGKDSKEYLVVDGVEGDSYDGTIQGTPIFSPDSRRVAVGARRGDKMFAVVDGKEEKSYKSVECLTFSPDSLQVAYVACGTVRGFLGLRRSNAFRTVVNATEGKEHVDISLSGIRFSPDSRHTAYVMQNFDGWWVVVDGVEHGPHDGIGNGSPIFSDDSRHVAYRAGQTNKMIVAVDGVQSQEYDEILSLTFGPDSQRLAYGGRRGDKWRIVVDRDETDDEYDEIFADGEFVWNRQDMFRAVAGRDGEFLGVEVEILDC